jgi:hypothetical protein
MTTEEEIQNAITFCEDVWKNDDIKDKWREIVTTLLICPFFDKQTTWVSAFMDKMHECAKWSDRAMMAEAEVERLKKGDFTEEEFQNLCHNFSEDDECRFKKGK